MSLFWDKYLTLIDKKLHFSSKLKTKVDNLLSDLQMIEIEDGEEAALDRAAAESAVR